MRIITLNANGIRSAERKGFFTWMQQQNADTFAFKKQKRKYISLNPIRFALKAIIVFITILKKGYSGVALYCQKQPTQVVTGLNWPDIDAEGRFIEAQFGNLSVISIYLPPGTSSEEQQAIKFNFMERFMPYLRTCTQNGGDYMICGDWHIAHKTIDIKNWRGHQKHSGFLPEERAWLDQLFADGHWLDAFRLINQEAEQYTWWSNRGQVWAKNVGWRIDYQIINSALKDKFSATSLYKDERFSSHASLIMDYDWQTGVA